MWFCTNILLVKKLAMLEFVLISFLFYVYSYKTTIKQIEFGDKKFKFFSIFKLFLMFKI